MFAKTSKKHEVLKKESQDHIGGKIKEAANALREKTASRVVNLEQKIEHKIDREATIVNNTVAQRRPLFHHN